MSRRTRARLIREIETKRNTHLITYILGDRPFLSAVIAGDAMRPILDHLRALNSGKKALKPIDLLLYSRGGQLEVPWPLVSTIREFTDKFHVLIPFRAHSAATMIALGADKIVMGPKGELGPIDPQLLLPAREGDRKAPPAQVGVEDITAYLAFVKEKGGLTDQDALSKLVAILAEKVDPILLGNAYRAYSHIRLVGRKLLSLHSPPLTESAISSLVEALTERLYLHGHAIGRVEARNFGFDVEDMDEYVEERAWRLFEDYESLLRLRDTTDAESLFPDDLTDQYDEDNAIIAVIESETRMDGFIGRMRMRRIRKVPPQVTLNMQLVVPPPQLPQAQLTPQQLQQMVQQITQAAMPSVIQQAIAQLEQLLHQRAPVEGLQVRLVGGVWRNITGQGL